MRRLGFWVILGSVLFGGVLATGRLQAAEWKYSKKYWITRHIKAVDFADPQHGWFAANRATIGWTKDGGLTWEAASLNFMLPVDKKNSTLNGVFFLDTQHGWIVGENGVAVRTTDGGTEWALLPTQSYATLNDVFFLTPQLGWIVGDGGVVLRTTDGGNTWEPLDTETNNKLDGVYFFDEQRGVVVGGGGTILVTTDGGDSWSSKRSPTALSFTSVRFLGERGWAVGVNGAAAFTADGGETWEAQETNVPNSNGMPEPIWNVDFIQLGNGQYRGIAAAEFGVILRTDDGGKTWQPVEPRPTLTRINDVEWLDENTAVAVGEFATILRTTDAGKTWQTIASSPDLFAVDFASTTIGWVSGHSGTVYTTDDGGKSWVLRQVPVPFQLFDVVAVDGTRGFIVGDNRTFLETTDGGKSWHPVVNPRSETGEEARIQGPGDIVALPTRAIEFADSRNGYLVGDLGKVFRTTDGGQHWVSVTNKVVNVAMFNNLYGLDVLDGKTCFVVGAAGTVISTHDGGETWERHEIGDVYAELRDVEFAENGTHGWAVGSEGTILATTDGGKTWNKQLSNATTTLHAVAVVNEREAWAAGEGATMLHTTDGGVTWMRTKLPTSRLDVYDVTATVDGRAWAVGQFGIILVYE